ncbi:hypothetical protein DPMN_151180 [Dreissena polymorpha]|uniref:Uncharacterized protein n=1 Tax=Dreissena polymorpha TaxID=45954 RepID=A0A9D4FGN3_DREPO|nr:hypothetical protein DPMN_151180 [Dreissena polymorpha]
MEQCRSGTTEQFRSGECRSGSVKQLGNAKAEQWINREIAAAEQISSGAMQKQSIVAFKQWSNEEAKQRSN